MYGWKSTYLFHKSLQSSNTILLCSALKPTIRAIRYNLLKSLCQYIFSRNFYALSQGSPGRLGYGGSWDRGRARVCPLHPVPCTLHRPPPPTACRAFHTLTAFWTVYMLCFTSKWFLHRQNSAHVTMSKKSQAASLIFHCQQWVSISL